jgi:hypothetical protein
VSPEEHETFIRIMRQHATTTPSGAPRLCDNGGQPDALTGTKGDRKAIFKDCAAASACVKQLRREIPGFRIWAYKCSRGRRHHHITSQPHPRPECTCPKSSSTTGDRP